MQFFKQNINIRKLLTFTKLHQKKMFVYNKNNIAIVIHNKNNSACLTGVMVAMYYIVPDMHHLQVLSAENITFKFTCWLSFD